MCLSWSVIDVPAMEGSSRLALVLPEACPATQPGAGCERTAAFLPGSRMRAMGSLSSMLSSSLGAPDMPDAPLTEPDCLTDAPCGLMWEFCSVRALRLPVGCHGKDQASVDNIVHHKDALYVHTPKSS